jgi:hypothetical protein
MQNVDGQEEWVEVNGFIVENNPDLSFPEWPTLHPNALHGFAGDFVEFATESSEADPAAVLLTFLVRFGAEINNAYMWIGDTRHRTTISAVIVGASSKSRKGTSCKPVMRLFEPLIYEQGQIFTDRAKFSPGPFSSGEGIIYAVRDQQMGIDKKTGLPIIIDQGVDDKRLFVLDEEFGGVMSNTKREGNTLSMIIRNIWDSGNLDPLTKNSKIKATGAHIGWVSHITLHELISKLSETEMLNGYANRILWTCARRGKLVAIPQPMPEAQLSVFQYELSNIIAEANNTDTPVKLSKEVEFYWGDGGGCYERLTQDYPGIVGCVINRAEAQVLR